MVHARLWKRILNCGFFSPGTPEYAVRAATKEIITTKIIVDCRQLPPPEKWRDIYSFSGIAVPFKSFWIEGMEFQPGIISGCLCKYVQMPDGKDVSILCFEGVEEVVCVGCFRFDLMQNGTIGAQPAVEVSPTMVSQYGKDKMMSHVFGCAYSALDTLQMLSCKNVGLERRSGDEKSENMAAKRHGGTPESYRYHVLVVRPPGARSDSPAQEIGIMPRHVCRGHFAEYGAEFGKGMLFGKLSGRFYIPPHLKGDKKNGVVEKDYEIPAT